MDGEAEEGWVVDEDEAPPVLWYFAAGQHLLRHLQSRARQEGLRVPQRAHHGQQIGVEVLVCLAADMESLQEEGRGRERGRINRDSRMERGKDTERTVGEEREENESGKTNGDGRLDTVFKHQVHELGCLSMLSHLHSGDQTYFS